MARLSDSHRPSTLAGRWSAIVVLITAAIIALSGSSTSSTAWVLIPVGRPPHASGNHVRVLIDGESQPRATVPDPFGGAWLRLPLLGADTTVVVHIVVGNEPRSPRITNDDAKGWLSPSELIDAAHPAIVETAKVVTSARTSASGKAAAIHNHLASTLTWTRYPEHLTDSASTTLALGYGSCANYARLFVALARASNVPARTVRGIVFDGTREDKYHQWAEYLDEANVWHPHDPTAGVRFDRSARGYVELMYAAEENPLLVDQRFSIVFDATPQPHDGRLGYESIARTTSSHTIRNTYHLSAASSEAPPR